MAMTDAELLRFVGVSDNDPLRDNFLAKLTPEKRALFDRMATLGMEVDLWEAGLGPKPAGVLIDTVRSTSHRRAWR